VWKIPFGIFQNTEWALRDDIMTHLQYVTLQHMCSFVMIGTLFEIATIQWGTGVKTNAKGGADAQLGEKQWMWRHLHPERATTSFQMRHSQGMTFPIALSTSPSSPSYVSALRIGLVPPVKSKTMLHYKMSSDKRCKDAHTLASAEFPQR
jgi:hypothetical protein